MSADRLSTYSRQVINLLQEARDLASVPIAERDTDDYRARHAAFDVLKARLLGGLAEADRGR
jgi:flagellar basal body rod protein FlgB